MSDSFSPSSSPRRKPVSSSVVAHGKVEYHADLVQCERLAGLLLDVRKLDAGGGVLLTKVVVHGGYEQGVQHDVQLVHVGLGGGKTEVVDEPL